MNIQALRNVAKHTSFSFAIAGITSVSAFAAQLYLYPAPIFARSYNPSTMTANCDRQIRNTITCQLEGAINDRLDYRQFAGVFKNTNLMDDLAETDSSVGTIEFTVLMPTNRALPEETWEWLQSSENEDEAERFVKAHIVEGQISPEAVEEGSFVTLAGNTVDIKVETAERIRLTGEMGSLVVDKTDALNPGNGVAIKIDKALVQPNL
ncbi:fasciclin domain-containing protein [Oscillatoriales cyanobacterium LEGE 11467]|uniref:Fasciclin domain-containing protein n=1 Tax=Zarconia navalis LEGE 11467 TaxID=1828826 RepID=A0A928Z8L1_9CYAN|nr:fasciclin domain-containing protein [Zarconia navalis]MBE9039956.1 fasciclin domain-containing protein [Zarconia navalis LEGE 11467]